MLTRILVAVIAIPILLLIIFFAPLWVLGIVVGGIAACSAWELLHCTEGEAVLLRMQIVTAVCAFFIPFCTVFYPTGRIYEIALFLLFAYLFCELMLTFRKEQKMELRTVTSALLGGGIMPILIASIVRLGLREHASLYVLLPFIAAFSCDSGAYFVGCALGKHKLAPSLSPKKTVEGSVGGFASAVVLMLVYGLILRACGYTVNLAVLAVYGFLGALACQLGDLCFSAIKRLFGVKDYSNLIPGHGGMLDRFDSMFWTAALIELLVSWVPAITK